MEQAPQTIHPDKETTEQVLQAAAIPCLNCSETLTGRYCASCGQSSATHRLSLHVILHDVWHSFTHTDIGLLHLIKELAYRPGYVMREYAAGKRKKYFNPWTFFILTTALLVYVAVSTGIFTIAGTEISKPVADAQSEEGMELVGIVTDTFQKNLKIFNFLSIPFLALCSWLLYRKSGYNYAENLVFQALVHGQLAVAFFVLLGPAILFPKVLIPLNIAYTVATIAYLVFASKQFFQDSWWKVIIKTLFINAVNTVLIFGLIIFYCILFMLDYS